MTISDHFFLCARFLGSGLATNLDHANWKERRSILNLAFHRKYVHYHQIGGLIRCTSMLVRQLK